MKILIITPCFNSVTLIEKTISSVLLQASGGIEITYMVIDGNSTDGTVNLLEDFVTQFHSRGIRYSYRSARDTGMYDALTTGFLEFKSEDFDLYGYINAGDFYAPRAFFNLNQCVNNEVHWITGINMVYNNAGDIISAKLPGPYSSRLIKNGIFGIMLPCIQQESTFWDHSAHVLIDFNFLRTLKLAGDFYLWKTFSKKFNLIVVSVWLSGFSIHPGQLSEIRRGEYFNELKSLADSRNIIDIILGIIHRIILILPSSIKFKYFKNLIRPLSIT